MKRLIFLLLLFPVLCCAQKTPSNPLGGNLTVQDAGTCSTTGSFLWQQLPSNASTTTVNLAGTFSGTLTIRISNNGGGSWTTNNTTTSAGTTSISTNGFTDICADVTTFTSGSFAVTITTGLNTGPVGPQGPPGSSSGGGGVVGGTFGGSPSSGYTFTSTPITTNPFQGNLLIGTAIVPTDTNTFTPGAGWTLDVGTAGTCTIAIEHQVGGSASSYTANFTQSTSQTWGSAIAAFNATSPTLAQAAVCSSGGGGVVSTGSNVAASNFLVAVFRYTTAVGPITAVSGCGATWTSIGLRVLEAAVKGVGDSSRMEIWLGVSPTAGTCTVTPTGISGASAEAAISVWTGIPTTNFFVDYAYNQDGSFCAIASTTTCGNTSSTAITGATTNPQYTINAVNNVTGVVSFTGRDSGAVFRSVTNAMGGNTGGLLFFKNGVYPGQTALQESVAGQTNYYVWSFPAPSSAALKVSWHVTCESTPQSLSYSPYPDSCLHQIMPSAYSAAAPSGTQLSGFWQRPGTFSGSTGSANFFVNGVCRIPDNQRTATICVDTFMTIYSSHIGIIADLVIPAEATASCANITPASSALANLMTGFRSNQSNTNESYFENTWVMGYSTPYNVLTNHPILINAHANCNQNAGTFNEVGVYGGVLMHYQDNHNINGIQLGCSPGGQFEIINMISEQISGPFARVTNATETTPGNCNGSVTVSTNNENGGVTPTFFAAGNGQNFRVSEGTKQLRAGLVTASTTAAATTGTTKQTLSTYTIPYISVAQQAGIFQNNPGATVRVCAVGITAANANTKTVELDLGATQLISISSVASAGTVKVCVEIVMGATGVQSVDGYANDGTLHPETWSNPAFAGTSTVAITLAATTPTASGDYTFKHWTIEYLGGQ